MAARNETKIYMLKLLCSRKNELEAELEEVKGIMDRIGGFSKSIAHTVSKGAQVPTKETTV